MSIQKRTLTKSEKNAIRIMVVAVIFAFAVFAWTLYANDYYEAAAEARRAILGNDVVTVQEKDGYYQFYQEDVEAEKGIIFYPGGKVDEKAYAPLLLELAENGYEIYLVKMPAKLAIFGMNAAEDIIEDMEHIEEWTMMGHSLGGAMAASYSAGHDEEIDRLVLLAAYSTEDLTDKEIEVFSFYGTEDKVLNMEKYKEYYGNLPKDVIEEVIEGGNHANFADYGAQDGDGEAAITRNEQQECVLDIICFYEAD